MLWQRVLTAVVLMPMVIGAILLLDTGWVAVMFAVALLVAAQEMGRLANLRAVTSQSLFVATVGVALALGWYHLLPDHVMALQWAMAAWWCVVTVSLVFRRRVLGLVDKGRPAVLMIGVLVFVSAWLSVVALHGSGDAGPYWVLLLFALIWLADSGAYFAGRAFGKRKLSPNVSPGKTWAGVAGAVSATVVGAFVLALSDWPSAVGIVPLIAIAAVVTLISIGGDLWESQLKREVGIKDSGSLLPGHGGMLDRIDSLLAAAPVFGLGLGLVGVLR
jgi:phosphatidate cytidylyltransferase